MVVLGCESQIISKPDYVDAEYKQSINKINKEPDSVLAMMKLMMLMCSLFPLLSSDHGMWCMCFGKSGKALMMSMLEATFGNLGQEMFKAHFAMARIIAQVQRDRIPQQLPLPCLAWATFFILVQVDLKESSLIWFFSLGTSLRWSWKNYQIYQYHNRALYWGSFGVILAVKQITCRQLGNSRKLRESYK